MEIPNENDSNPRENPLEFLENFLGLKILKLTFVKVLIALTVILAESLCIGGLFISVQRNEFQKYISYILISQPATGGLLVTTVFPNIFENIRSEVDIRHTNPKVKERIISDCKFSSKVAILMILSTMVCEFLLVCPIFGDEEEYNVFVMTIRYYFNTSTQITYLILFIISVEMTIGLVYPIIFGSYMLALGKIYLYFLIEKLLTITDDFDYLDEDSLFYDKNYQNTVHRRLVAWAKEHTDLKSFVYKCIGYAKAAIMVIPFGSLAPVGAGYFISNVSYARWFIRNKDISPKNNFRVAWVLVVFVIIVASLCATGQGAEDGAEELFTVAEETPWPTWNQKNKRTLLLILINIKVIKVQGYGSIALNFQLLLTFYKWIYTTVSVLY